MFALDVTTTIPRSFYPQIIELVTEQALMYLDAH